MKDLENAMQHKKKLHGLYIGEVVNSTDPKNRNRVQVNINGITDEVDDAEDYLWAEQGGATGYGESETVAVSTSPAKGELVYIMFLNGSPSHPIYFAMVRGGSDESSHFDGSNYVIHLPSGDIVKIGTNEVLVISGNSKVTVKQDNVKLENGTAIINANGGDVNVNNGGGSTFDMNGGDITLNCTNFLVNSTTFKHNAKNVGDTHVHSEPDNLVWSSSSKKVTTGPS